MIYYICIIYTYIFCVFNELATECIAGDTTLKKKITFKTINSGVSKNQSSCELTFFSLAFI